MKKVLSALLSALVVSATVTALPLSANAASVSQDTQSVGDSVSEIVCDPMTFETFSNLLPPFLR